MYPDMIMSHSVGQVVDQGQRNPPGSQNLVVDEPEWRIVTGPVAPEHSITASRWQALTQGPREAWAETPVDGSVVKIVLRQMDIRYSVAGKIVHDGWITPGTLHVSGPGTTARCLFRTPYDVVHLHVSNSLLAEYANSFPGHSDTAFHMDGKPVKDHVVERLARSLLDVVQHGQFEQLCADSISVAIVARIFGAVRQRPVPGRAKIGVAPPWRLKRAIEYFEAHLAEQVSLAEVASVTGITRMHFAAQFRAATGLSPHQYLLRRRIDKAQELLMSTDMSLVEIALAVGFQSQSHFTTVFKRLVGDTPSSWRRSRMM